MIRRFQLSPTDLVLLSYVRSFSTGHLGQNVFFFGLFETLYSFEEKTLGLWWREALQVGAEMVEPDEGAGVTLVHLLRIQEDDRETEGHLLYYRVSSIGFMGCSERSFQAHHYVLYYTGV